MAPRPHEPPPEGADCAAPVTGESAAGPDALSPRPPREYVLRMEKMAFGGQCIARLDRFVLFVDDALPGELARVRVYKKKKDFAFARATEILEVSPDRVAPGCAWVGNCGGCSFRHCSYAGQLRMKREVLAEALHGVPGAPEKVADAVPSPQTDDYRNKMVYTFGRSPEGELRLGLHRRGSFMHVLPANDCLLQSEGSRQIVRRTLEFAAAHGLDAFHEIRKTPGLRTLMVREARATGHRMVELLATADLSGLAEAYADALGGLADTVFVSRDDNIMGSPTSSDRRLVRGEGHLTERLNGLSFLIGPDTFFQSNTAQAEALFAAVREEAAAGGAPVETALDLFTGTGPIALHLASVAGRVWGAENWEPSVRAARRNAELNGIGNVAFTVADVNKALPPGLPRHADLVVVDPPRPGLSQAAVDWILNMTPRRILYVSCNPSTLARDLKWFAEKSPAHEVASVRPFDLFPHTFHVETLVRLERK